jgi:putative peptidoglycan lipid II flippase
MKNYIGLVIIFSIGALLSFLNQMQYAYYFGAGDAFDTLNAALSLPFSIIGVASGSVALIVMPILNKAREGGDDPATVTMLLIRGYYKRIIFAAIFITCMQIFLLYDQVASNWKIDFIVLSVLSSVFLFFSFINAFFIVFFNFNKKYIVSSINVILIYSINIVMCYIYADSIGVKIVMYSLILSSLVLFILFIYNFSSYYRRQSTSRSSAPLINFKTAISGIVSILPFTLPVFIDAFFLTSLESGSLSYVSYANKLLIVASSILIQPLNLILFPKILDCVAFGDVKTLKKILAYLYLLVISATIIFFIIVDFWFLSFMEVFFVIGDFTIEDSVKVYNVLLFYIVGSAGMVVMNIQNKIMTSLELFKPQILSSVLFLALYILMIAFLIKDNGYLSAGISYLVAWFSYAFFIAYIINKKINKNMGLA